MRFQPVLRREPARLRAHLEHADARCIVDEQLRVAEQPDCVRQALVIALADGPRHQAVRVDARDGREQADEELLPRHFQAEEPDGPPVLQRRVLGDVQHEARLAHRRTRRDDDEVAGLQAARHLIEVGEAGGDAGDQLLRLEQLLDLRQRLLHDVAHRQEPDPGAVLGNGEDRLLRFVEDRVRVVLGLGTPGR